MIVPVLATGGALAAIGGLVAAGGALRLRALAAVPQRTCGACGPGPTPACQLQARAQTRAPLVAPVSGTECVYYRVELSRRTRIVRGRWEVEGRVEAAAEWWLEDETGALPVDATGAELAFPIRPVVYDASPVNPAFEELLRQAGLERGGRVDGRVLLTERCVPAGQPLFARGLVQDGPALAGGRDLFLCPPGEERRALRRERLTAFGGAAVALVGLGLVALGA